MAAAMARVAPPELGSSELNGGDGTPPKAFSSQVEVWNEAQHIAEIFDLDGRSLSANRRLG